MALRKRRGKITLLIKNNKTYISFYFMFLLLVNGNISKIGPKKN